MNFILVSLIIVSLPQPKLSGVGRNTASVSRRARRITLR
jgi:hypothetical protein